MMKCKLTLNNGKAAKAHIIPAAFFYSSREKRNALVMRSNADYPKRSLTGIYDEELVTLDGEAFFNKPDNYAYKVLIQNRNKLEPWLENGKEVGVQLIDYDYHILKIFFLSLLWRASETQRGEYNQVSLGPHTEKIREMIINGDPGTPEEYSVVLFRFNKEPALEKGTILFPYKTRQEFNGYKFYLNEYIAVIKVDRRKSPKHHAMLQLCPDKPLRIVNRGPLSGSPEAKLISHILEENEDQIPNWYKNEIESFESP